MATQPTNLPVPSESPRDLKFNAGKIDEFVTSLALQYIDRFGNSHYTIEGLKQLVLNQIYNLGWNPIGTFQGGAVITAAGDVIQDETNDVWYRWDDISTLPKVVPAGSTPESTGGIGEGKWLAVDVSDVLRHELAEPTGAWLVGRMNTLQDLLAYDVREGYLYETEGYYSAGDKGSAKYLISDTKGDIPDLAYECANGLYAILQHNGTITLEQLGAKGSTLGESVTEDSWDAFYKAYKIKKTSLFELSLKFTLTKISYYVSKPVLLCTGMVIESTGGPWIVKIYYGGVTVTPSEVPNTKGVYSTDADIVYSSIRAACIFVNQTGTYCYYSELKGVQFRIFRSVTEPVEYGIYCPYGAKVNIENVRVEKTINGLYSRDFWNCSVRGLALLGMDTSATPPSGSCGVKIEPYLGVDAYEPGGTSCVFDIVGCSGFQYGFKITRQEYSTYNSCYSEKGNDIALEFHGCDGITINGFGLENLSNVNYGAIRFYNTRANIDSLTFAFNCKIAGGVVVWCNTRSIVGIQNISLGRVINTGSFITLFLVSVDSSLDLSPPDIPSSLKLSQGYSFASVNGKMISDHVFSGELGIASGSATTNAVSFTINDFKYSLNGESISVQYTATWTSGSGSDMQIFGFPKIFASDGAFFATMPTSNSPVYARWLQGTNRVKISNSNNAVNVSIPSSGTIFMHGKYNIV